jgi:2-amino-1-hydroxyethylphosphonate dioxygenase (glycine-forming)
MILISDKTIRYLTAVDASYYDGLSEASKQNLRFQGGPFQGEELAAFETDPLKDEMVKLRKWDDQAKIVGIEHETPRTATYMNMIQRHLEARSS